MLICGLLLVDSSSYAMLLGFNLGLDYLRNEIVHCYCQFVSVIGGCKYNSCQMKMVELGKK